MRRGSIITVAALGLLVAVAVVIGTGPSSASSPHAKTPIKHVVVIYDENISFDHYFGTYPKAANKVGERRFSAARATPHVDRLTRRLLRHNPNAGNPRRIAPSDVKSILQCDNNHNYSPEQKAFDHGRMDKFVENTTGTGTCSGSEVMNYFDGNTVAGMWNYAQHFAMSDRFHGLNYGPSTIGALNLVSGTTAGVVDDTGAPIATLPGSVDNNVAYANQDPFPSFDGCSTTGASHYALSYATSGPDQHRNVGDLLDAKHVTWGWFQGGFKPTGSSGGGPVCGKAHDNIGGASILDYSPHHNPFAYYRSTANPSHAAPSSQAAIGHTDRANHQYDLSDFNGLLAAGRHIPSVSFLKAPEYQDGHAGYSDPLDEQRFLVTEINKIQRSRDWSSTAIIVAYDDSDGWYDHQFVKPTHSSQSAEDFLDGPGRCGVAAGVRSTVDRCGPGPRLPLLVISPWAKPDYVDHAATDQASILRFIEDNWSLGRIGNGSLDAAATPMTRMFAFGAGGHTPTLLLDAATGARPGTRLVRPVASLGRITCRHRVRGTRIKLACRSHRKATRRTAVRIALHRVAGDALLASARTHAHGHRIRATLRLGHRIDPGRYVLRVTVAQKGRDPTVRRLTLHL